MPRADSLEFRKRVYKAGLSVSNGVEETTIYPSGRGLLCTETFATPALGVTTIVHAAVTDTGAPVTVTTAITDPDFPRNITATSGGTAADIKAIQVTINGTDVDGVAISEVLPIFTVNTATTVVGSKAFKTVTSIEIPAHDGTAATTAIGTGAKLGLSRKLSRNTVINAFLANVKESVAPTVAVSSSVLSSNTVTLSTALDGTAVIIDYYAD